MSLYVFIVKKRVVKNENENENENNNEETFNLDDSICQGVLYKAPIDGFGFGWKTRKFELSLTDFTFKYYRQKDLKGTIDLREILSVEENDYKHNQKEVGFVIEYRNGKNVYLSCDGSSNRSRWMRFINRAIHEVDQQSWEKRKEIVDDIILSLDDVYYMKVVGIISEQGSFLFHKNNLEYKGSTTTIDFGEYDKIETNVDVLFQDRIFLLKGEEKYLFSKKERNIIPMFIDYFKGHTYTTIEEQNFNNEMNEYEQSKQKSTNQLDELQEQIDTPGNQEFIGSFEDLFTNVNKIEKENSQKNLIKKEEIKKDDLLDKKSVIDLMKLFDDAMLYKNKQLMHRVADALLKKRHESRQIEIANLKNIKRPYGQNYC